MMAPTLKCRHEALLDPSKFGRKELLDRTDSPRLMMGLHSVGCVTSQVGRKSKYHVQYV